MTYLVLTTSEVDGQVVNDCPPERFESEADAIALGEKFLRHHEVCYGRGGIYQAIEFEKNKASYEVVDDWFKQWPSIYMPTVFRDGRWQDYSYRNDTCAAAFMPVTEDEEGPGLRLWVEHRDRLWRENREGPRFCLQFVSGTDEGWCDGSALDLWEGEDEAECLEQVNKYSDASWALSMCEKLGVVFG